MQITYRQRRTATCTRQIFILELGRVRISSLLAPQCIRATREYLASKSAAAQQRCKAMPVLPALYPVHKILSRARQYLRAQQTQLKYPNSARAWTTLPD